MKLMLLTIAAIIGAGVALVVGLSIHDRQTTERLNFTIEQKLGHSASRAAMEAFMRRNTDRYDVDAMINFEYAGIMKQSRLDKTLSNRRVGIVLTYNPKTDLMINHRVEIYYTFL